MRKSFPLLKFLVAPSQYLHLTFGRDGALFGLPGSPRVRPKLIKAPQISNGADKILELPFEHTVIVSSAS